jgi:hypothetical protein
MMSGSSRERVNPVRYDSAMKDIRREFRAGDKRITR